MAVPPHSESILPNCPEARGIRVERLVHEAKAGRLRIPAFQRPLRWKTKQVIDFFDSIRRGFPVGNLLLSREPAAAQWVHFGPCAYHASSQQDAWWVIDGQQRSTALVAGLARTEAVPRGDYWAIWYDLEAQQFFRNARSVVPPSAIPLNVVNDSASLLRWIRNWVHADDNPEWIKRALELGKAIREYELPVRIVSGADDTLLRLISTRVNTSGVNMQDFENFQTRYYHDQQQAIRQTVARLAETGFGLLDEDLFLRCLNAVGGISDQTWSNSSEILAEKLLVRTERTLRRVFRVLQEHAGIPHWKLLPYHLPLIFLSVFFDRFPAEHERADRLAAAWVWQGALVASHQDSTDANLRRLLNLLDADFSPDTILAGLLVQPSELEVITAKQRIVAQFTAPVTLHQPTAKLFVLGLLAANPQPPPNTFPFELELYNESLFESFIDETTLTTAVQDSVREVDLEPDLSQLLSPLVPCDKTGTSVVILKNDLKSTCFTAPLLDDSFLRSHVLNMGCITHLSANNFAEFRQERRRLLERHFDAFILDRLGDVNDHRPSIQSITTESEDTTANTFKRQGS